MVAWRTGASLLVVAALAVAATGCGGSDDDEADGGGARGGGNGSGGPLQLDEPVRIVGAVEVAGESRAAINSYDYGMRLAVDAINEAGGIGGQPIEYERVPLSISDQAQASSQFQDAVGLDPSAIIGFPSSVQHEFLKPQIDQAQVPILSIASAGPDSFFGGPFGSEFLWTVQTYNEAISYSAMRFLVEELEAERIGLLGTDEQYGNGGIAGSTAQLHELGMAPADVRQHPPDAADLSEDVAALEGVDAIGDWDYPGPLTALLEGLVDNDMDVPVISGESTSIVVHNGMATDEAIDNLYGVTPCSPATEATEELAQFHQAYVDRYDEQPNSLAAEGHDAVYVVKAAIEAAGSADPANINQVLDGLRVTDGVVCAPDYHADGAHIFGHTVTIVDYAADGSEAVAKTYEVDDQEAIEG